MSPLILVAGVYGIFNQVNGRMYVGSACNVLRRWKEQERFIRLRHNKSVPLCDDWIIHKHNFCFVLLECCQVATRSHLLSREEYWLQQFPKELRYNNFSVGMPLAMRKQQQDPEFKGRLNAAVSTRLKQDWKDPAYRARVSKRSSEVKTKFWSNPSNIQKQSRKYKRKWKDPVYREATITRLRNPTSKTRAILSKNLKEKWRDPEFRARMVAAMNQRQKQKREKL